MLINHRPGRRLAGELGEKSLHYKFGKILTALSSRAPCLLDDELERVDHSATLDLLLASHSNSLFFYQLFLKDSRDLNLYDLISRNLNLTVSIQILGSTTKPMLFFLFSKCLCELFRRSLSYVKFQLIIFTALTSINV